MWKSFQRTFFFLRKIPPSASKCFAAIEKVSTLLLQGQVNLLDGEERSCKNRAKFHNCFSFCLILALCSFVVCRRTFLFGGGQAQGTLWTNISWYVATTAPAHVQSVIHCVLRTGTWKNTPTIFTLPTRNLGLLVGCGDLCFSIHCILCWMLFYAIHFTSHWGRASLDDRFVIIIVSPKQELLRSQHKITIIAAHTKYDSLLVYVESFWWTS